MTSTARSGFTLVELLIVIVIIAVLSTIGVTIYGSAQKNARDAKRKGDLKAISNALEQYKTTNGQYPFVVQQEANPWYCSKIVNWTSNITLVNALTPYFAAGIPSDPSITDNYKLDLLSQGTYFLYVSTLENPPPVSTWPLLTGNGCTGSAAVPFMIRGQL